MFIWTGSTGFTPLFLREVFSFSIQNSPWSWEMLRLLPRHIYVFHYLLREKNVKGIKCLGILKKYVAKNKINFCFKKKNNVPLITKVICLSHNFQTWFHDAYHLLYYPQMFVFSFYTFVILLRQFLRNRRQKQC